MPTFPFVSNFFCNPEMSNPRLGHGKSSLENECPILMGQGLLDKEAWVREFNNYLTAMRKNPCINSPSIEWISNRFSMISLNQNQSAATSLPPDISGIQPPKTIIEVQSFLGLTNQMSKYSSDYSMITTKKGHYFIKA